MFKYLLVILVMQLTVLFSYDKFQLLLDTPVDAAVFDLDRAGSRDLIKEKQKNPNYKAVFDKKSLPDMKWVKKMMIKLDKVKSLRQSLPKVKVDLKTIKHRKLPYPDKAEAEKYLVHCSFLNDLISLCRVVRLKEELKNDKALSKKVIDLIFKNLNFYMVEFAPDRPYWRVTMRFSNYKATRLASPVLALLDRIVLLLHPYTTKKTLEANQRKFVCLNVLNYTDHLINNSVGAQNRGVNWMARLNHINTHFFTKHLYGFTGALKELKEHLADGYEYAPFQRRMGTLPDGGFWHHGSQAYCVPYGTGDFNHAVYYLKNFEKTPLELDRIHYAVYETQLLDKWQYIIYNKEWLDLSITGGKNVAQIKRYKAKVYPRTLSKMVSNIMKLDKSKLTRLKELKELSKKIKNKEFESKLIINKNFWHWEYMVHRRPGWYIGFKGMSSRTITAEWDQNAHLTSGHTAIMRKGDEYWRIRPALNWTALPGITTEQLPSKYLLNRFVATTGQSDFANGVSDGKYGLFAFEHKPKDKVIGTVHANKAGFFFEKGMVALTSGINRHNRGWGNDVWTTLDQRIRRGVVTAFINGNIIVFEDQEFNKSFDVRGFAWVHHDGITYFLPENQNRKIIIKSDRKQGEVKDVLPHNKKGLTYDQTVFLVTVNHEKQVINDKCSYMVIPNMSLDEVKKITSFPFYKIIKNDIKQQAVIDENQGISQLVFYSWGEIKIPNGLIVSSEHPLILMLRKDLKKISAVVANPLQLKKHMDFSLHKNKSAISFFISGKLLSKNKKAICTYDKKLNKTKVSVLFNKAAGYEGDSVTAELLVK